MPIVLIGNKTDKISDRKIFIEKVQKFCHDSEIQHYFECSAKQGKNVIQAFETAARIGLNIHLRLFFK